MSQHTFLQQLEKHNNELDVREHIANGTYNAQSLAIAQEWLRRKEEARSVSASAARDAREKAMLSATRRAERWAMYAAIIATTALITTVKDQMSMLMGFIFGSP